MPEKGLTLSGKAINAIKKACLQRVSPLFRQRRVDTPTSDLIVIKVPEAFCCTHPLDVQLRPPPQAVNMLNATPLRAIWYHPGIQTLKAASHAGMSQNFYVAWH
jgi:hypothetical protein